MTKSFCCRSIRLHVVSRYDSDKVHEAHGNAEPLKDARASAGDNAHDVVNEDIADAIYEFGHF